MINMLKTCSLVVYIVLSFRFKPMNYYYYLTKKKIIITILMIEKINIPFDCG